MRQPVASMAHDDECDENIPVICELFSHFAVIFANDLSLLLLFIQMQNLYMHK